jgi:hypothetical protein
MPSTTRPAARLGALCLVVLCALPLARAAAFGAEGHRIVGLVAEEFLDAPARAELARLDGGESLATVGLWLDEHKGELRAELPGSDRWHYDNRPACAAQAPVASYCADGECASAAFAKYRAVLADRGAPPAARLLALRVVVHLVADVHQPLHVADNGDRGANRVEVLVGNRSRPKPLHAAWDVDFVRRAARGADAADFAARLAAEHRGASAALGRGSFGDWMQESYRLAQTVAYGRLPGFACGAPPGGVVRLPRAYSDEAAAIVREQLARAGIRLATLLNGTL